MTWQLLAHWVPVCMQILTSKQLLGPLHEHIKAIGSLDSIGCMLNAFSLERELTDTGCPGNHVFSLSKAWQCATLLLLSLMWHFMIANSVASGHRACIRLPLSVRIWLVKMSETVATGYVLAPGRSVILKRAQASLSLGGVVISTPGNVQSALEYRMKLPAWLSSAASCSFAFLPARPSTNLHRGELSAHPSEKSAMDL